MLRQEALHRAAWWMALAGAALMVLAYGVLFWFVPLVLVVAPALALLVGAHWWLAHRQTKSPARRRVLFATVCGQLAAGLTMLYVGVFPVIMAGVSVAEGGWRHPQVAAALAAACATSGAVAASWAATGLSWRRLARPQVASSA